MLDHIRHQWWMASPHGLIVHDVHSTAHRRPTSKATVDRRERSESAVTSSFWWDLLIGLVVALLLTWATLVVALVIMRPRGGLLRAAVRLLPDVLRLIRRMAADGTLPRGVRLRLGLLLTYLAIPIDLVPDFVPVLGYADDAIIVIAVLRSVVRLAGLDAVRAHWPGTDDGFAVLIRLTDLQTDSRGQGGA
jgi:uncharacterized membrane protein YkvA (DUF1232 family)